MARVAGHLSVEDLEAGFRSARDPTAARHFQVIWLLARGHTIADVAAVTSFVPRWIEQLLARYRRALLMRGRELDAGDTVTTGTCTGILQVLPGQTLEADFGALGQVSVAFV